MTGVFLEIFKAFDKVWHEDLIYKLKQNGIKNNLLDAMTNFLNDRKKRVVLNDLHSKWVNIEAGVPQVSILGLLLFLIYINDSADNFISNPKLFADDTSLFSVINNKDSSANKLNQDLNWKMRFNPEPSKQAQEVIFFR